MSSVSFLYLCMISSESAIATFFAGVILSSPYKIIEWLISIISTVLVWVLYSVSTISRSSSVNLKSENPWLICAFFIESVSEICSRVSPNWNSLLSVPGSSPWPGIGVAWFPLPDFFSFPKISSREFFRMALSDFAVILNSPSGVLSVINPLFLRSSIKSPMP